MRIAIVGAGIVGRLVALHLSQGAHDITLFERLRTDPMANASFIAAGMLAPAAEIECGSNAIYQLGLRSLQLWPALLQQLTRPVTYAQQGSILIAHRQDQGELQHFADLLKARLPEKNLSQRLDAQALAELEPQLGYQHQHALYLPDEAYIDNQQLLPALAQTLQQRGITWHSGCEIAQLQAYQLTHAQGTQQFDWIFDCRGLGAQSHWPDLRGVRGEVIHLHAPEVQLQRPVRLLHPRYRVYIVPRAKQHYIIGASELETDEQSPISVRSCLELLSAAFSVHPSFAEARITATYSQCRPAFADNEPRIENQPGLTRINGLYRHGYLLAPALVADALTYFNQYQQEKSYA